ncbi:MAG: recombinase family protein [Bdellovibrionales bacterium]|nr:recombinase family protein [Bdellovibrionales bacterium]
MEKRVAIYLRVSTQDQNTDLQRVELESFIKSKRWTVTDIFEDKATGTNANRPSFKALMDGVRSNKFDVVICWKLDRLFRSLKDLILTLQVLSDQSVEFIALKDNIDLTTSTGRLLMHILGAFGEFEASIIRTRVKAGLEQARRRGVTLGRRKSRPSELIRELRSKGYTYRRISELAGCSVSTAWSELNHGKFENEE